MSTPTAVAQRLYGAMARADGQALFALLTDDFVGTVSNIRTPSDVNGVYGAAGAGVAIGRGAGAIVLTNQNGAVLTLSGRQAGLIVAADLNGLLITLR